MKKFFTVSVLFFSLISYVSAESENNFVFDYACRLFDNDAKKEAALEYKRYLFIEDENPSPETLESCRRLTSYYEEINDIEHALYYSRHAINIGEELNSTEKENLYLKDINLLSMNKIDINTQTSLFGYTMNGFSEKVRYNSWKALIRVNIENRDYIQAQKLFELEEKKENKIIPEKEAEILKKAFIEFNETEFKNPKIALALSIIPGLGQCYAHRFKDGLNAFVLDGGLIAISAYSISTGNYSDFFFYEFSPLFRFYRGNLYNAQRDTYDYNDEKCDKIFKEVLKILRN